MAKIQLTSNYLKHTSKNPLQQFLIRNFYKTLVALAKPLEPETVLDAGCGEGFSLNELTKTDIGKRREGIDDSRIALFLGKKLFPKLLLEQGDLYGLPYKDDSFDLVVCTEVLEHLDHPENALAEVLRVSRKHLIVSVPNEPFFMLSNFLRGKNLRRLGNNIEHINHWGVFSFPKLLTKERGKIRAMRLPFPWIIVLLEKG